MCSPFVYPCVALVLCTDSKKRERKNETQKDKHEAKQLANPKKQANTKPACNIQHTYEGEVSARAHLASCCALPRNFALNGWKIDYSTCTHTGQHHKKKAVSIIIIISGQRTLMRTKQTTRDHTTQYTKRESTHYLKLPTTDGGACKIFTPLTTELRRRLTHVTDAFSTHHWHLRSNDLRCLLTVAGPCRQAPRTQPQLLPAASVHQ